MEKFKAVFNYYLSSYWNNPRTLNNMYSSLKIFFERNNKINSTVTSFGNVFRNSKWSSLQVQNIKKSFILKWLTFFLILLITFVIFITYSNVFYGSAHFVFFYIKQTSNEYLTNMYYFLGCLSYSLYKRLTYLFLQNQNNILKYKVKLNTTKQKLLLRQSVNTQSVNTQVNVNLFLLQKTLLDFGNCRFSHFDLLNRGSSLSILPTLQNKINFLTYKSTLDHRYSKSSNIETTFVLNKNLNTQFNQVITSNVTLSNLQSESSLLSNDPTLVENFTQGLNNIAKQQRWLTKNFWSNSNFVSDSNKVTEAKKFIQNPVLSSNLLDTNLWISNKFSSTETEQLTIPFSKLKSNRHLTANFNFFDISRFYLNQRYTSLNQLPNQFITNLPKMRNVKTLNVNTLNLKSKLAHSYFARNFTQNIQLYTVSQINHSLINEFSNKSIGGSRYNIFVTTQFNDLLQSTDLQALNSVNSPTNSPSLLQINTNSNAQTFKS